MPETEPVGADENRWEALLRVTRSWRLEWNSSELLERVSREAVELLSLERGIVFLQENEKLLGRCAWPDSGVFDSVDFSTCQSIAERVVHTGRPVFAHEFGELHGGEEDPAGEVSVVLCVPLTSRQGILGALYVDARRSPGSLTRREHELLEMLGLQAAAALEHLLLYRSAITDPLTGLFSHRYFQQQVNQEIRRATRLDGSTCVVLLDLDNFKPLNDTCGHEAGNRYLEKLAETLREALRDSDVIARFGGDEFELLLPETDGDGGRLAAEKVRTAIEEIRFPEGPPVTASLGVAAFPHNAADAQELFLHADEALYRAKGEGRNRTVVSAHIAPPRPRPEEARGKARPRTRKPDLEETSWDLGPKESAVKHTPSSRREEGAREQVDGHAVVKRLGTGSTGEVLLVRQPELDREVALKRPHTAQLTEEQAAAFEREARLTARLQHPGVVPVHSMGSDSDGRLYYTMRRMQDMSLGLILERLRKGERETLREYSLNALLEILQRVAETVAYAHSQRVTHGDLNPGNIMVGEFGETVVIDWGEGSRSASAPKPGPDRLTLLTGSPRYAAPEQVTSRKLGPAVDVHSLGAILYEILTGRSPYLRSDTRATLDALRRGDVQRPERVAPEMGVDPVLSELCMAALSLEPGKRPSAREFAERLGRYVRSEREWEVIRFGPDDRPVVESEWRSLMGNWELRDGEWVSRKNAGFESIIVWRTPVPGDFRFVAEGWVEGDGELSLIGHGPGSDIREITDYRAYKIYQAYGGYCFQFGAEENCCTKLARDAHDVLVRPGLCFEPGRRYRMEIEYQAGWLRCFIDEEQVFAYRELFPLAGTGVGFYGYGEGTHMRPLEVHRQNWALQPAMRMADELYVHGYHDAAVERYLQISDRNPHRLEGDEARLKIGICKASSGDLAGARTMFRSVQSGPMSSFALAEEAMLEFRSQPEDDVSRGAELFERMVAEHPDTPAKTRICEAAARVRQAQEDRILGDSLETDLELRLRLFSLAARTYDPPMQSQIQSWLRECTYLLRLGRYSEALESARSLSEKTYVRRNTYYPIAYAYTATALACGRSDLLPLSHWEVSGHLGVFATADWTCSLPMHIVVRGLIPAAGGVLSPAELSAKLAENLPVPDALAVLLSAGDAEGARQRLASAPGGQRLGWRVFSMLPVIAAESGRREIFETALEAVAAALADRGNDGSRENTEYSVAVGRARWSLEIEGDMPGAAAALEGRPLPPPSFPLHDGLVLQVMLASLGAGGAHARSELADLASRRLSGTPLDMARMFAGEKPPVPGENWPHPLWRPEWRLWLAIWLRERGESERAREILQPARDARYGLANSQPAITKFLEER